MFKSIFSNKFNEIIKYSHDKKETVNFKDLLDVDDRKYIESILRNLKNFLDNKEITEEEQDEIFDCFGYNPREIAVKELKMNFREGFIRKNIYKDIPIKITTALGSKGLTRDYAFLVNFDDKYIIDEDGKKITNENICNFLVTLTRARKRVYIYTSENKLPTFASWVDKKNIKLI